MDRALLTRVEKQAWFHRFPRGLPAAMFVVAMAATVLCIMVIERLDQQARRVELERNATEVATALQRRAAESVAFLSAASALFATQEVVDLAKFRDFTSLVNHDYQQRGVVGIGWARRMWSWEATPFEDEQRSAYAFDFRIRPLPKWADQVVVPVTFLEPQTPGNLRALGFDMYSEPARRAAMDEAVRSRRPTATGKVQLVQDEGGVEEPGFVIYVPTYRNDTTGRTLLGFVYSPFRAEDFLDSSIDLVRSRQIDIRLYDGNRNDGTLMASRLKEGSVGETMDLPVNFGNRQWMLSVTDKRVKGLTTLSMFTLLFGVTLGLILAAITRWVTHRAAEDRRVLEWLTSQSAIRTSLTRELNHRVKNTLANVLSIVSLTRRRSANIDEFAESLTGRLRALSATHDLLSQREWSNAPLGEVARSELAPYMDDGDHHVELDGPEVQLAPNDALSLGLALHELATNAAKYGALTTSEGRVRITWRQPQPDLVEVLWRESNGPPVSEPNRRGFGLDLIEKIVAHELQNAVDLKFQPEGVECTIRVPVRERTPFDLRASR